VPATVLTTEIRAAAPAPKSLAPAVDNAFAILDCLAACPHGAGVSEISRQSGLSKSSCFNILTTMLRLGAVEKRGAAASWHLGAKLVELGTATRRGYSGRLAVRTQLQALADKEQLVCLVGQVLGGHAGIVVLDRVFPQQHRLESVNVPIGEVYPLTAPAMGRAVLAAYDDEEARVLVQSSKGYAGKAKQAELLAALATVRVQGYAVSLEEYKPGIRAVAALVPDHQVDPGLVLCLVGRREDLAPQRLARLGTALKQTASRVAETLRREPGWT
jgi:IclR family acetate operon transcriptional repressor